jgi:hypothetical protein
MVLVMAAILIVFFVPFPHSSVFNWFSNERASTSTPPNGGGAHPTNPKVLAEVPKGFHFAGPPVLSGSDTVVAVLGENLRLARIDLLSGRVKLGPHIAGEAWQLFTDPTGGVFLLSEDDVGNGGHLELWSVPSDLKPIPLFRLRSPSGTNSGAVAAPVPGEEEAWLADGREIDLVSLTTGALIRTAPMPHGSLAPANGLAVASPRGPLYVSFCRGRGVFSLCGAIAEIDQANGTVISQRLIGGYADQLAATSSGAWVSGGEGGNGRWLEFFSATDLRPVSQKYPHVSQALGWLTITATGNVVWSDNAPAGSGPGAINCFSVTSNGSVHVAAVVAHSEYVRIGLGYPFAVEPQSNTLLFVSGLQWDVTLYSAPIPRACGDASSTVPPKKPTGSPTTTIVPAADFEAVSFSDDRNGAALVNNTSINPSSTEVQLAVTHDGGHSWSEVSSLGSFPDLGWGSSGSEASIEWTSRSGGFAWDQGSTLMLRIYDGGRRFLTIPPPKGKESESIDTATALGGTLWAALSCGSWPNDEMCGNSIWS